MLWPRWLPDSLPVMPQEHFLELASTMRLLGHQYSMIRVDSECTQVKDFVMQGAKRDSICFSVRSSRLVPLDVGCLQGDGHVANAQIESTQGTAVFVSNQHLGMEPGIARPVNGRRNFKRQADSIKDVLMDRLRKMR
jgi:hypothetical protein